VTRMLHNICSVFSGAGIEDLGMNGGMVSPCDPESFEFAGMLKFRRPATIAWSLN